MKKFKVKTKDNLFDKIFEKVGKLVKKRPTIINTNDHDLEAKCIMVGNHSGASGAFVYRTFMDKRFMTWGAHPMCEGYISRYRYLNYTFYRKKLGYSKFKSFMLGWSFGLIAGLVYGYAGVVPIYYDMRFKKTIQYSFDCLEKDVSVFIFPENSNDGYKEHLDELFGGFLRLSRLYYKKYNVDLPIYTLRFIKAEQKIVIGKPYYYQELLKEKNDEEILEMFRNYLNELDA